jgi:hypothetical protein
LPADRACGHRGIRAQRHFAADDALDALARSEHQHHVGGLHAYLEAEAAAGEVDEYGVAPAAVVLADDHDAAASSRTDSQTHFDDAWNDRDRVRAFEQPRRNVLLGHGEQFGEHLRRCEQSRVLPFAGDRGHAEAQAEQQQEELCQGAGSESG